MHLRDSWAIAVAWIFLINSVQAYLTRVAHAVSFIQWSNVRRLQLKTRRLHTSQNPDFCSWVRRNFPRHVMNTRQIKRRAQKCAIRVLCTSHVRILRSLNVMLTIQTSRQPKREYLTTFFCFSESFWFAVRRALATLRQACRRGCKGGFVCVRYPCACMYVCGCM